MTPVDDKIKLFEFSIQVRHDKLLYGSLVSFKFVSESRLFKGKHESDEQT